MKALNKVIRWTTAGVVVKRGKKTICYEIDKNKQVNPKKWTFTPMEITSRIYNGCDCYPWMEVFAWLPVKTIGGKRVWLQKVYKRKFWAVWGNGFHMEPEVEYGELFDILAETNDNRLA